MQLAIGSIVELRHAEHSAASRKNDMALYILLTYYSARRSEWTAGWDAYCLQDSEVYFLASDFLKTQFNVLT